MIVNKTVGTSKSYSIKVHVDWASKVGSEGWPRNLQMRALLLSPSQQQ